MQIMGFMFYPGELPFTTVRGGKWQSRVAVGDLVQIQGECGCTMPKIAAKVVDVREHAGPIPEHLLPVYAGQLCWDISLERALPDDPGWARYQTFPI